MQQSTADNIFSKNNEHSNAVLALNAAGIGTWMIDPVHNKVEWDDTCRELMGFAQGETATYADLFMHVPSDDAAAIQQIIHATPMPDGDKPYHVRFRILQPGTGKIWWVLSKGKAYFDGKGTLYRIAGTTQDVTDAVQDKEKIKADEALAQLALENANSGYFHVSLLTDEIKYSAAYARILTGENEQPNNRDYFFKHLHPDDLHIRNAAQKVALETGSLDYEARVIWNDGTIHWMRAKGTYLKDDSGSPYALTGTIHDTTAEHLQKEAVKEAEDLLATSFNNASLGMAFTDLTGRLLNVNAAYAALLGYTQEEFANVNYQDITHPEDRVKNKELFDELAAGKRQFFNLTKRYIHKSGEPVWIRINVTLLSRNDKGEGRTLATVRDISAEVKSERALAQSEAMFRNVTKSSPTGLWLSGEDGGLIYLNDTLVDWTGMPYDDLLGAGWANAVIEEDRQRGAEVYMAALAARAHYDVMFRIKKGDGSVVWCRAAGDPYYAEDGSYAGYAGYCMDIDELVNVTNELMAGEARFRSIIEQAPMAIALLTGRELIIEVGNDKMFEVLGRSRDVTGSKVADVFPELADQGFIEMMQSVYDTGVPYFANGTLVKLNRTGAIEDVYFDFAYTPLRYADGSVTGVMAMGTEVTAQVVAKKAIEGSEAKFRSLIEEAPVATALLTGRELKIEIANETMLGYWGKGSNILGKPLSDALPELQDQHFLKVLDNVYTTGVPFTAKGDKAFLIINGTPGIYYFDYTFKPIRNNAGEINAIIETAIDVTEQVTARKELEESELFSRSIIDNSPVAKVVFTGPDMVIKTVNQNMLAMLGRDASIIGMPFMEAIPELRPTPLMERLAHVYTTGETYYQPEEKIDLIKNNVTTAGYYNYIYKALKNTAGEIYGIIVTATEVTAQVLARQRVEEAESSLRGAVELADLAMWSIDLQTRILDYSERLREWFGFDKDEVIGVERAYMPVVGSDRARIKEAITHAISPGTDGIYDIEYTYINLKTGKERILHAQGKAYYGKDGIPYKLMGTAQDVTNQRQIQLALKQQVQERTEELAAAIEELQATNEELGKPTRSCCTPTKSWRSMLTWPATTYRNHCARS